MARPEFAAAIAVEASRKRTDTVGWGLFLDKTGPGIHSTVTVTSEDGFSATHILLASEGLTLDEVMEQFLGDTISEVRTQRRALPAQAQGQGKGRSK